MTASTYPDDGDTAEALLAALDRGIAHAKRLGRDQVGVCGRAGSHLVEVEQTQWTMLRPCSRRNCAT